MKVSINAKQVTVILSNHQSYNHILWHILGSRLIMPSSVIRSYHYDPSKHILRVIFNSGKIYDYLHVPEETYRSMKGATSKGEFLNRIIKRQYDFRKIK